MLIMVVLHSNKEKQLRDMLHSFPSYTDVKIANNLKVNKVTVAKYRKEIDVKYDAEFIQITAGKWIKYYGLAAELLLKYITQLEEYKTNGTRTIILNNETMEIPLSGIEKGQLIKTQADILTKLCEDAGNGELREVIRMMRSGKVPTIT